MNTSSTIVIRFCDRRGRPLVILRKLKNGRYMYVLKRYNDMTDAERSVVRSAHANAVKNGSARSGDGTDVFDIEEFLSFREERPCG